MWVATWSDYGEREPCNPGSLVLYIVSYSNRATFVTIYLLPLPFIPFPLSLSLSLVFRSRGDWIFITVQKKRWKGKEEEEKKVAVFKERYFAKSVETAVEEEEEEDGDRVSLKPDEATAIEKLADPPYRFSSLGVGRRGKDVSRCPYQRNSALNDIGRAAVNLGTGNPLPSPPRSDEREPI